MIPEAPPHEHDYREDWSRVSVPTCVICGAVQPIAPGTPIGWVNGRDRDVEDGA